MVRRWVKRLGASEAARLLEAMNTHPPPHLRVNRLRATPAEVAGALAAAGFEIEPGRFAPDALRVRGAGALTETAPFREGAIYFQDESSQLAALVLAPRAGERILDALHRRRRQGDADRGALRQRRDDRRRRPGLRPPRAPRGERAPARRRRDRAAPRRPARPGDLRRRALRRRPARRALQLARDDPAPPGDQVGQEAPPTRSASPSFSCGSSSDRRTCSPRAAGSSSAPARRNPRRARRWSPGSSRRTRVSGWRRSALNPRRRREIGNLEDLLTPGASCAPGRTATASAARSSRC